jgi:hypothetical protein
VLGLVVLLEVEHSSPAAEIKNWPLIGHHI